MKKYICILLTLIFTSILFVGCGNKTKEEVISPELVINDFITKMYTVDDYAKIDMDYLDSTYPKDKYTNELRQVATEEALNTITIDRMQLMFITICHDNFINSKVISSEIDKYLSGKDGTIIYIYKAKLKFTFPAENRQTDEEVTGQVTVKMINNKWMITQFDRTNYESIVKKYK